MRQWQLCARTMLHLAPRDTEVETLVVSTVAVPSATEVRVEKASELCQRLSATAMRLVHTWEVGRMDAVSVSVVLLEPLLLPFRLA